MDDEPKKTEEQDTVTKEDYLRLAADFENFKKQSKELQQVAVQAGKAAAVNDLLDVMDAFDAAREQGEWTDGLEMAVGKLDQMLKKYGTERVETDGKTFDPATMEAVGTAPGGQTNTVQSRQRAGWTMHGKVIRPARVIVYQ